MRQEEELYAADLSGQLRKRSRGKSEDHYRRVKGASIGIRRAKNKKISVQDDGRTE